MFGVKVFHAPSHAFARRAAAFLILCGALALVAACRSDYPASAKQTVSDAKGAKTVKLAPVEQLAVGQKVEVNGTLTPYDQATVSLKVPGRLSVITVDLGSVVRKGQLIAQVEQQDYKLRVSQAEAALQQARVRLGLAPDGKDDQVNPEQTAPVRQARAVLDDARAARERALALVEQGVIARAEFDTTNVNFKVAQSKYQDAIEEARNRQGVLAQRRSELDIARQQLADTSIYAPFDGVVGQKRASVGEYLKDGSPVVDLVKTNPLRLRAEVPERAASAVRAGQQVRVTVEGAPHAYAGQVKRLSPSIIEQNRVLIVEADVPNDGGLRPGAFARAEIVTNDKDMAVTVPSSAIVTFAGVEKVITVKDGKAVETPVTTGRRTSDWTEILSGVNVGDKVIVEPGNLQSGQAVVTSDK